MWFSYMRHFPNKRSFSYKYFSKHIKQLFVHTDLSSLLGICLGICPHHFFHRFDMMFNREKLHKIQCRSAGNHEKVILVPPLPFYYCLEIDFISPSCPISFHFAPFGTLLTPFKCLSDYFWYPQLPTLTINPQPATSNTSSFTMSNDSGRRHRP